MKTLYFDCFAGASGNMILGALIALGIDENELISQINLLDVADFNIEFTTKDKSGISAIHAEVKYAPEHAHRHLHDIERIINDSRLKDSVKKRAVQIFTKLAEAEAKVHGTSVEKIHFHEVGAMDAIIDVVGACVGFEILGIEKFYCSKIHTGSGFVKMAHGKFPIPPPAVAEILQSKSAPIYQTEIEGELITPTGAAIIATVCDGFGAMPEMQIEKTAYGAGTREYKDFPNVLRLIKGEQNITKVYQTHDSDDKKQTTDEQKQTTDAKNIVADAKKHLSGAKNIVTDDKNTVINKEKHSAEEQNTAKSEINRDEFEVNTIEEAENKVSVEHLVMMETNLDDISSEILGFMMEKAFNLGALDCWFTPIQMKKNRPATMISILCEKEKREVFTELLYLETTTLGIRIQEVERECLPRETVEIETEYGAVKVKIAKLKNKIVNVKPEYDQIREIALKSDKPLREIEREIEDLMSAKLKS